MSTFQFKTINDLTDFTETSSSIIDLFFTANGNILDCRPDGHTLPPPLGNFADIPYLKEQSFLHRIRDVCTL